MAEDKKELGELRAEAESVNEMLELGRKLVVSGICISGCHEDMMKCFAREARFETLARITTQGFDFIVPDTGLELSSVLEIYMAEVSECLNHIIKLRGALADYTLKHDKTKCDYDVMQEIKADIVESWNKYHSRDNAGTDEKADNVYDDDYSDVII